MISLTKKEKARIYSNISFDIKNGCWNYTGYLSDGYGRIYWRKKRYKAHRFFYEIFNGQITKWINKESPELDHICNNRACVNPQHLRLVTPKVNTLRGNGVGAKNANKILCIHGHNSFYKVGDRRRCKECRKIFDTSEKRQQWKKEHLKTSLSHSL